METLIGNLSQKMEPLKRNRFRSFQIRWKEALGNPECPYLYRWTLIFFGFSIRLHHWIKSDDRRFFHDHSCNLISIILWGKYKNVIPIPISEEYPDGKKEIEVKAGTVWRAKAKNRHYLDIPKEGAWTLLLCGRPYHKWGFYVNNHKWRPLRYFHKYGVIQTKDYQ